MKKKKYISPKLDLVLLQAHSILAGVSNTAGENPSGGNTDVPGYGGGGNGSDMEAKRNNVWSSWEE